jgi:hypothetical protein
VPAASGAWPTSIEHALLDGDFMAYESPATAAEGVNTTFYVEIEPDLVAFHKPRTKV